MNDTVRIPRVLARRLDRLSLRTRRNPDSIVRTALEKQIDYEEWLLQQVEQGLAELDRGEVISHEELKRALAKSRAERAGKSTKAA